MENMKNKEFIQKTLVNEFEIKSYYDKYTNSYYSLSSNGVYCVVKNNVTIEFYRNDSLLLTTIIEDKFLKISNSKLLMANYLDSFIFLNSNNELIDNVLKLLKEAANINYQMKSNNTKYIFSFINKTDSTINHVNLIRDEKGEVYQQIKDAGESYNSLSNFFKHHTKNTLEIYKSMESEKILVKTFFTWTSLTFVYYKKTHKLSMYNNIFNNCHNMKDAQLEYEVSHVIKIKPALVMDYICEYLFKKSLNYLTDNSKQLFIDYQITFDTPYKENLKIIEMITI